MASIPLYLILWLTLGVLYAVTRGGNCVETGLSFSQEPQDVVAWKGQPLLLNCSAVDTLTDQDAEPVNITWQKDGSPINDERRYVLSNGSLFIRRVVAKRQRGRSDEGYYECVARNHIGTILSRKAQLQIASFSDLDEDEVGGWVATTESYVNESQDVTRISGVPLSVTATAGEVVRLECSVKATPRPTVVWEKDRNQLPPGSRYTTLPSGALEVTSVTADDAGRYRCSSTVGPPTRQETRQGRPVELLVLEASGTDTIVPALLSPAQQHYTSNTGTAVVLECAASGLPRPRVLWTRKNGSTVESSRHRIIGQGNLEISSLALSDSDDYTCTVTSSQLVEPLTATASLRVIEPPFINISQENKELTLAKTARLINDFGGTPALNYTWYKNGQKIHSNGRIRVQGATLVIGQSDGQDAGYYQCRAENEGGMAQVTIRVFAVPNDDVPSMPTNLHATHVTSESIQLEWERSTSRNGDPIIAYSVHYNPTNGGAELQMVADSTDYEIKNLEPHTNYSFYVVAYTTKSPSLHSRTLTQITDDDTPSIAPEVRVRPLGATSLKVEWDPLSPEEARGTVVQYKVYYSRHPDGGITVQDVSGTEEEYIITGLEPNVQYDVRVQAGTRAGYPDLEEMEVPWPWVSAVTTNRQNSGAPDQPQMYTSGVNETAISVEWDVPTVGPQVDGYQLYYHEIDAPQQTIPLGNDISAYTISGLTPYTWYEISLLARNEHGESEPMVINVNTHSQGGPTASTTVYDLPPLPPDNVEANPISDTKVHVRWDPGPSPARIILYDVRYSQVAPDGTPSPNEVTLTREVPGDILEVVITDLKPFTMYEFSVRAHTEHAKGPYSSAVTCRTVVGVPSAPTNLQYNLMSSQEVQLTWQPPEQRNGPLVCYIIMYSRNRSAPDNGWTMKKENGTVLATRIEGLVENSLYYFKIKAVTDAGFGPDSAILMVHTSSMPPGTPSGSTEPPQRPARRELGIIVGVTIGLACILISLLIILLRNKCFQASRQPQAAECVYVPAQYNGVIPNSNGNGYLSHGDSHLTHEMDSFMPILHTPLPENEQSDTKGGYSMLVPPTPHQNGVIPNGLYVKLQNGQVTTSLIHGSDEEGPEAQIPLRNNSLSPQQDSTFPAEEADEGGGEDEGGGLLWRRHSSLDDIDHSDCESWQPQPSMPPVHIPKSPDSAHHTTGNHNNGVRHLQPQHTSTPLPRGSQQASHGTPKTSPPTTSLHSSQRASRNSPLKDSTGNGLQPSPGPLHPPSRSPGSADGGSVASHSAHSPQATQQVL